MKLEDELKELGFENVEDVAESIRRGLDQADKGEFVDDEEMEDLLEDIE